MLSNDVTDAGLLDVLRGRNCARADQVSDRSLVGSTGLLLFCL
jgi:hypothetical protein